LKIQRVLVLDLLLIGWVLVIACSKISVSAQGLKAARPPTDAAYLLMGVGTAKQPHLAGDCLGRDQLPRGIGRLRRMQAAGRGIVVGCWGSNP